MRQADMMAEVVEVGSCVIEVGWGGENGGHVVKGQTERNPGQSLDDVGVVGGRCEQASGGGISSNT